MLPDVQPVPNTSEAIYGYSAGGQEMMRVDHAQYLAGTYMTYVGCGGTCYVQSRCENGVPRPLLQGVIDVSERMLDSLPEWRRALGRRVMNEVTRLVVVSWGKASKEKKEQVADDLGLDRGA